MDPSNWNCCRLCLNVENLHPIFTSRIHSEKYTEVLLSITGIKIEINDNLPQQICTTCITFINESTNFRHKCNNSQSQLLILRDKQTSQPFLVTKEHSIKNELFESERQSIDISHLINDNDFHIDSLPSIEKCEEIFVTDVLCTESIDTNKNSDLNKLEKLDLQVHNNENLQSSNSSSKRRKKPDIQFANLEINQEDGHTNNIIDKRKKNADIQVADILQAETKDNLTNKINSKRKKKSEIQVTETDKNKPKLTRIKNKSNDSAGKECKSEKVREPIECEYCHKILTSRLSLRNHYKIHTGFDVVCEHCGKKFITRRLLLMHCRAKHGYEKTDKCSFCDYKASNAEQVKIHERLHTGEKPYKCAECNAGFHRKSSYLQHIAIHLPEKTVQCDQCSARFKSVTLMKIHKNRHRAAQYAYQCLLCRNSFARRRNAARHIQRVHQMSSDATNNIDRLKIC